MPKAITSTEIVAEMIAKKIPMKDILIMAYESGLRRAAQYGIHGSVVRRSRWAGDQAQKVAEQIKDMIAK